MSQPRAESEINRRNAVRSSLLYQYEAAAINRQVASVCIPGISFICFSAPYSDRRLFSMTVAYVRRTGEITRTALTPQHTSTRELSNGPTIQRDDCYRIEQFPVDRNKNSAWPRALRDCLWLTACQEGDSERSFQCIDLPINFSPIYLFGSIENRGQHRLIYLDCHSHS